MFRYLERFHSADEEASRQAHKAFLQETSPVLHLALRSTVSQSSWMLRGFLSIY